MARSAFALLAAIGIVAAPSSAAVYEFPHLLELSGSLHETALGSAEIPYQSVHAHGEIDISKAAAPAYFNYDYLHHPHFGISLDPHEEPHEHRQGVFSILFQGLGGQTVQDPEDDTMWILTMHYRPMAIIGDDLYTLPGDGTITFTKHHPDPQPLDLGDDSDRHGAPVVFLIESPLILFLYGDHRSGQMVMIDANSRLIIETAVPGPASGLLLASAGLILHRRRRDRL